MRTKTTTLPWVLAKTGSRLSDGDDDTRAIIDGGIAHELFWAQVLDGGAPDSTYISVIDGGTP